MSGDSTDHDMEDSLIKQTTAETTASPRAMVLETTEGDAATNEDDQCGCRGSCCGASCLYRCGLFQHMATAKWALAFFCMSNMLVQTMSNGLFGVSVSTLEKRFELRSTESGFIGSSNDFARVVGMIFLMFLSKDVDKPRWIGWGNVVAGISMILFMMPHFMAPEYSFMDKDIQNYCGNVTEPDCSQSAVRNYRYWFIFMTGLVGIGGCPLYAHGLTYLDENVEKKSSTLYSSVYFAMGGLGPALGFVCGGLALKLYTYITVNPEDLSIDSSDYLWVGAWWLGFLVCGILLTLNSVPLLMLPKHLPGTEKYRENRNIEVQKSHLKRKENNSEDGRTRSSASELSLLMRNRPYIFVTLGMTMNVALIYGFNTFGAKYLETVFGISPFQSSLLYGICAIFASSGAQVTSGFVVKKLDLSVPGILKFMILAGICSALCSIGFIVHCEELEFAGSTVPYPNHTFVLSPNSECNEDCGCSTDRFQPVCSGGIMYYSPCFAGCTMQVNETTFSNCSCASIPANSSSIEVFASSQFCDRKPCHMILPFIFIVFLCFFTSVLTLAPAIQVAMRCVPFSSRDTALSFQAAVTRLVGIIPARILVGFVLDFACVAWSTECGEKGSCKAYKRGEVARNNTLLLLAQTITCAVFYVLALVTYKPVEKGKDAQAVDEEGSRLGGIKSS